MLNEFSLKVPNESRHIRLRLGLPKTPSYRLSQLIIIATGLHSHMDKKSQLALAESYQQAGFSTLQFNFMGHGEQQNKSDGKIEDITLSSSLKDLKAVWDYSRELSKEIDTSHTAISANSYGALISLMALEKRTISPESMVLLAPFSPDKFKRLALPLHLLLKLMPDKVSKILKLPVSTTMLSDFLNNHTRAITRKDLLGSTAVHFFVGSEDKVSSVGDIQRWCRVFNANAPSDACFTDHTQAHCTIYPGVPHFEIPEEVRNSITAASIDFIRRTRALKSHSR